MAAASGRGFLRQAWRLTWPYWKSEEKWSAIALLAAIVGLNLFSVWLNVRFNRWNNDFYNALQEYKWAEFWHQFAIFGALAQGDICAKFCISAGAAGLQTGICTIGWAIRTITVSS